MKNLLLRFKNLIKKHKSFLISRIIIFILIVSFFKINQIEIRLIQNHERFEDVKEVDYSKDSSKLVCYANHTSKEVQKTCDNLDSKDLESRN
ncbi:hypothetical protein LEP1GSC132_2469 [Leptospira kirschneri str. 200803703]|uniref:hypothetical protein n=1 Tax=Leptospira kirschneri TaxID=29507 RepID=UPI0002BEC8BD|nr:hypothetical protein [Leptospira kirschneri]EMO66462.1 hypothetical protein LEP1GSC132_2469 [Leptospira kirschneri str. 200803703]